MTEPLFRSDPYLRETAATVRGHTPEGGIVLDRTIFYATGGGQPGDAGRLDWAGGGVDIATAVKAGAQDIALVPAEPAALPPVGTQVTQTLDWDRRYRHMRIHTALHLLSVVIPMPVSGGAITAEKGRLDFDMPEAPEDRDAVEAALNDLVSRDLAITEDWITDDELGDVPVDVEL